LFFVARQSSPITPTGQVSFYDGNNLLGTVSITGTGGIATFTTSALNQGIHPITAVYAGDAIFTPAITNAVYEVVNRDPTATAVTLTTGTNPSIAGDSLTFTATVTSQFPGTPSGVVQFKDGNMFLGAGVPGGPGIWTFTTAALTTGPHAITAIYGGDINFFPSVSPVFTQVVESNAGGASTTTLTVNGSAGPVTVNFGVVMGAPPAQKANFVVMVTGSTNGDSVVLMEGNRQLGATLTLAGGQASYATQLPVGQHNIQAFYIGNGTVGGSPSLVVVVDRSPRPRPR